MVKVDDRLENRRVKAYEKYKNENQTESLDRHHPEILDVGIS